MSSMVMVSVSTILARSWSIISRVRGIAGLLLNSRVVLSLSVLSLAILHLLLLAFRNESLVDQLLIIVKGSHSQLKSQIIV